MEKLFIPQNLSKELKLLGFVENCVGYYDGNGIPMIQSTKHCLISAPLWQQAFEFLLPLALKKGRNEFDELVLEYDGYDFKLITRDYIKDIQYEEIAKGEISCLEKLIEIVLS